MYKSALMLVAGIAAGVTLAPAIKSPAPAQDKALTVQDFPDLAKGLMETPGCLGVQTFPLNNGRTFAIATWFKNRKAMEAWYYSKMHQDAMTKFFPGMGQDKKPFANFKDKNAPILVVASVTPGDKPIPGTNLAVSQIAIEGYTPIPGGLAFGGTFAPEKLEVPHLVKLPAK